MKIMGASEGLDEGTLQDLYNWMDTIPLSRPKKNITREFSDGVSIAEIVKSYFPTLVELHDYAASSSAHNKISNWHTLNRNVFRKLNFELSADVINNIVIFKAGVIERVLLILRSKIDCRLLEQQQIQTGTNQAYSHGDHSKRPESDQGGYLQPSTSSQSRYEDRSPGLSARHGDIIYHKQTEIIPKFLPEESEQEETIEIRFQSPGLSARHGDIIYHNQTEMVPKFLQEEREQEETIEILEARVHRLEYLLHLKDIRIDDLQARIEHLEIANSNI